GHLLPARLAAFNMLGIDLIPTVGAIVSSFFGQVAALFCKPQPRMISALINRRSFVLASRWFRFFTHEALQSRGSREVARKPVTSWCSDGRPIRAWLTVYHEFKIINPLETSVRPSPPALPAPGAPLTSLQGQACALRARSRR